MIVVIVLLSCVLTATQITYLLTSYTEEYKRNVKTKKDWICHYFVPLYWWIKWAYKDGAEKIKNEIKFFKELD